MFSEFGVQLFLSFSGYTNVCEILKATKSKRGQIGPINCLRVMSMFWVILGHTLASGLSFSSKSRFCRRWMLQNQSFSDNILDVFEIQKNFFAQVLINGFFSVDTFFFIGGVLLAFMWFKGYSKDKKKLMSPQGWLMFYVHRFIRYRFN